MSKDFPGDLAEMRAIEAGKIPGCLPQEPSYKRAQARAAAKHAWRKVHVKDRRS